MYSYIRDFFGAIIIGAGLGLFAPAGFYFLKALLEDEKLNKPGDQLGPDIWGLLSLSGLILVGISAILGAGGTFEFVMFASGLIVMFSLICLSKTIPAPPTTTLSTTPDIKKSTLQTPSHKAFPKCKFCGQTLNISSESDKCPKCNQN